MYREIDRIALRLVEMGYLSQYFYSCYKYGNNDALRVRAFI